VLGVKLRCVYCDLDGTLVGRGGSLFHDGTGAFTMAGARTVEACARADVELVPVSGRRKVTVEQPARVLGAPSFVYESGAAVVISGEEHWLTGDLVPRDGRTIFDQITDSGAATLLLEHFAGRLEYHDPWHLGREVSHLFRGDIDAMEADALLVEHGFGDLRMVDNGTMHPPIPGRDLRAYHLLPRAASKAAGVRFHQQVRGYEPEACIAIGDSREDLGMAAAVGTFWLVGNALEEDPTVRDAFTANVRVAEGRQGAGVYEAVMTELAERPR
jgi:hydroxymethylpyrimidine pyrophosphatase-like HAD family hydrolase